MSIPSQSTTSVELFRDPEFEDLETIAKYHDDMRGEVEKGSRSDEEKAHAGVNLLKLLLAPRTTMKSLKENEWSDIITESFSRATITLEVQNRSSATRDFSSADLNIRVFLKSALEFYNKTPECDAAYEGPGNVYNLPWKIWSLVYRVRVEKYQEQNAAEKVEGYQEQNTAENVEGSQEQNKSWRRKLRHPKKLYRKVAKKFVSQLLRCGSRSRSGVAGAKTPRSRMRCWKSPVSLEEKHHS